MPPTSVADASAHIAARVLLQEAAALQRTASLIGPSFGEAVEQILKAKGRLVVTGIGKSAQVAQKMVATFNSTGQPALFMHAADAIHGDLGMVQSQDVVLALSNSGNTPEIKVLVPLLRRLGVPLIALTGSKDSYLGLQADHVLDASITAEADPHNLAPTTSTTVAMALGDALAIALLDAREFQAQDFAAFHPGGALGKRMYLKVSDLYKQNAFPQLSPEADLSEVILTISANRLGAAAVLEPGGSLAGIITDGDLRRMLAKTQDLAGIHARDILSPTPQTIDEDETAAQALATMQERNITQLIVTRDGSPAGFVHLHDLLREGLV